MGLRTRRGTVVDRFRDRLVFPVRDPGGQRVVGFLGRALTEGEDIPKYLNSPGSALYRKGDVLYGLGAEPARRALAGGARPVLVEGPLDAIAVTCAAYAAANFALLGETLGYARSAGRYHYHGRRKRVWVYLLHRDAPAILAAAYPHPLLAPRGGVDVHTVALAGDSGLLGLLEGLTDPRKKRGIRHRVAAVRTMVAAATMAGATRFRSVADYIGDLRRRRWSCSAPGGTRAPAGSCG